MIEGELVSGDDTEEKIPWNRLNRMVIAGRSPFSGGVVYRAVKEDVPVTFIDIMGRARGHLFPEYHEMPEMLSLQEKYRKDKEFCLSFAKEIISAKIHNSTVLLQRNGMDVEDMKEIQERLKEAKDVDSLRGYEGAASKAYFAKLAHLVAPFEFKSRVYHPPDGPINTILSLGYSVLYNRIATALKDSGFNARFGFFHQGRGSHCALASDLMEELRHIIERVVLSLIHLGELKPDDFTVRKKKEIDICRIGGEGFRKFVHRFEKTMAVSTSYGSTERMSYNAYIDEMTAGLKRSLRLGIPYKALRID